ncbi:MAG: acetyl-CoA carboxylase biotin carboxyl carrier protein [Kiritimatiellaeota bacterium]|nr:acetyl-CoA carboxylase biotin carboxyl carrier protein [Kiritimatiellota bacterium]
MNIEEIARIAKLMEQHELTEFLVETDEMKLNLKREKALVSAAQVLPVPAAPPPAPVPAPPAVEPQRPATRERITIDSPIVGTFYASPAPDKPPYVKEGDEVSEDTVVCIIEAMKVMNEIKAEKHGVIARVLVENAAPVEFGQPLFEIKPF